LVAAVKQGDTTLETYRLLAAVCLELDDLDAARVYVDKALAQSPNSPTCNKLSAEIFDRKGDSEKAVQTYRKATYLLALARRFDEALRVLDRLEALGVSGDHHILSFRGWILSSLGRNEEALSDLDEVLETEPNLELALGTKAQVLRALGRLDEALEAFDRVVALAPDVSWLAERGDTLRLLGRYDEAMEVLERALKIAPDDTYALGTKAQVLRAMNRLDEALEAFDRVVALAPDVSWPHAERGDTLFLLGRNNDALRAIEPALEIDPDDAYALGTKGQVLRAMGRLDEALEALGRAAELAPELYWLHAELCETLRQLGRNDDALRAIELGLKSAPVNASALETKGLVLRDLGRRDEAIEALRLAVENAPDVARYHTELGELLAATPSPEAATHLERALELSDGKDAKLWSLLGKVRRELGESAKAIEALRLAVENAPDVARYHTELGELLAATPSPEAATHLERALELSDGKDAKLWSLLGKVRHELGETAKSRVAYRQSYEIDPKLESRDLETRVHILLSLDRDTEVMLELLHALEHDPDLAWANIFLGKILCDKDYNDEALEFLERGLSDNAALDREPALRLKGLLFEGMALAAVARHDEAIDVLRSATEVAKVLGRDSTRGYIRGVMGWALENLGEGRAKEALEAYQDASLSDPDNLWWLKGQANCLNLQGEREKAVQGYRTVLEIAQGKPEGPAPETLSMLGWCHFRLGEFDRAIRLIVQSLSLKPSDIVDQFDLALVMLCAGRSQVGLQEYVKAVEMAELKPVSRRCGLFFVAQRDLELARKDNPRLDTDPEAIEARELIGQALAKSREFVAMAFDNYIEGSVELEMPCNIVYYHINTFNNYPKFMEWLTAVEDDGGKVLRCRGTFGGIESTWKIFILEQTPYTRISWQSATREGHSCALTLFPVNGGTRLRARISFDPDKTIENVVNVPDFLSDLLKKNLDRFRQFLRTRYPETAEKPRGEPVVERGEG